MTNANTEIEKIQIEKMRYLEVWTFTAENALELFGLDPKTHSVVVLKERPETEREIRKYAPTAKLFSIEPKEFAGDTIDTTEPKP